MREEHGLALNKGTGRGRGVRGKVALPSKENKEKRVCLLTKSIDWQEIVLVIAVGGWLTGRCHYHTPTGTKGVHVTLEVEGGGEERERKRERKRER